MNRSHGSLLKDTRVLILEDEFLIADDLARAVREAGGSPVGPVNSVQEAGKLVAREKLDAAIVDLNLRGQMASEFVEQLAATGLPCLIVSGYADEALPESLAAIPRVEKPISPDSAVRALANELARAD